MSKITREREHERGTELPALGAELGKLDLPGDVADTLLDSLQSGDVITAVIAAIQAAREAGHEDEREARKRRREGRKRDPDQLAADTTRMVERGLGRRAAGNLEALAALQEHYQRGPEVMAMAVAGLRAREDISDTDIAVALGHGARYGRQEIHRRYGPRHPTPQSEPAEV